MKRTIIITAGGTGGHIFPALAIAKLFQSNYHVIWVGGVTGLENEIVPKHDIPLAKINITGLRKKGLLKAILMPFILLRACKQSLSIILRYHPVCIIGFGGYVTFPICIVGKLFRVPIIIHEQNSIPGLVNKILAKLATTVMVAFNGVLTSKKAVVVGNPVRDEIVNLPLPTIRYSQRTGGLNILVLGGSLGAKILNEIVPLVCAKLNNINSILHQVGRGEVKSVVELYTKLNIKHEVVNFIDDMASAYAKSDLIICRSGASTVSEVCVAGIAAIFVPYPYAVDDHQRYNAESVANANAAKIILQKDLTVANLVTLIANLSREDCMLMANKVKNLAINDSKERIYTVIRQKVLNVASNHFD